MEGYPEVIKDYRVAHPGADWLALYKDGTNLIPPPKIINEIRMPSTR